MARAKALHKNPAAYCHSVGQTQTWEDGGCKLYYDCNIYCPETCDRQPNCNWLANACQVKASLTSGR